MNEGGPDSDATASAIGGVGEIALRVDHLGEMQAFYEEVVGLELMCRFDEVAFFDIAPGLGGHTQILALFDRSDEEDHLSPESTRSTLDHFAFEIPLSSYHDEWERLTTNDIDVRKIVHEWVQWRSLHFHDPEGNEVELVAFDPGI